MADWTISTDVTLPPLSAVAQGILELKNQPDADAKRLAALIELDPSLAGQIMKAAGSAYFGYRGKICSIQDAISRVLGFDRALHIAIGLAAGYSLQHRQAGPLGMDWFWRHALYTAAVMQSLAGMCPASQRPLPGIAYLAGLLHDIGFLLLGYAHETVFHRLGHALEQDPGYRICDLEEQIYGRTHADLGAQLLRSWRMPAEVVATAFSHHNPKYQGSHRSYAHLGLIADRLLARLGMGDDGEEAVPEEVLAATGLTEDHLSRALEKIDHQRIDLERLVEMFVSGG